jgi:acyl-CoA synthetase (AMP-forming)/AMP-acid ligase II
MALDSHCVADPPEVSTLVDLLRWRAREHPHKPAYTFLHDEGAEVSVSHEELDRRARGIAVRLRAATQEGERALLLYPPGLDYIAGFFGCLYAGVIAVPVYPPEVNATLNRIQSIVADAQTTVAMTTTAVRSAVERSFRETAEFKSLRWLATDAISDGAEAGWQGPAVTRDTLAFLQYTSGSTGTPKGVMVTYGNLFHNLGMMQRVWELGASSRMVSWLPLYHDMGLILGVLEPLYAGFPCTLMSPMSFLRHPVRWLQAIAHDRATISPAPDFAYALCVRRVTPEQRPVLDLSTWEVAVNGAEPIRRETLDRFVEAFGPCGFHREAFQPAYGLAEATLFVSGGLKAAPPVVKTVLRSALEQHQIVDAAGESNGVQAFVGCGQAASDQTLAIVHAESRVRCPADHIGEIWIAGPSVARGYWCRPGETESTFRGYLADGEGGPFLRTGDLGFVQDGQLFITGRLKDLIIIRGQNYAPQDIEWTVQGSHPAIRPGGCAAFSADIDGEERLVVVAEVSRDYRDQEPTALVAAVRKAVAEEHGIQTYAVLLGPPGCIPKTSSGKIRRHSCRTSFLAGTLDVFSP